jgi:hypothetical protein
MTTQLANVKEMHSTAGDFNGIVLVRGATLYRLLSPVKEDPLCEPK